MTVVVFHRPWLQGSSSAQHALLSAQQSQDVSRRSCPPWAVWSVTMILQY